MAKTIFITATGTGQVTLPADYVDARAVWHFLGAGGNGGISGGASGGGAGGGEARGVLAPGLVAGGVYDYSIPVGGAGNAGADGAWLKATNGGGGTKVAEATNGGNGPSVQLNTALGGTGGTSNLGTALYNFNGGNGGALQNNSPGGGSGGGGAASAFGAGKNGASSGTVSTQNGGGGGGASGGGLSTVGVLPATDTTTGGAGGVACDSTPGGTPGTGASSGTAGVAGSHGSGGGGGSGSPSTGSPNGVGGAGGAGIDFDSTHGAGGGGGGGGGAQAGSGNGAKGGIGGTYGGGAGGNGFNNTGTTAVGGQGLIVCVYDPSTDPWTPSPTPTALGSGSGTTSATTQVLGVAGTPTSLTLVPGTLVVIFLGMQTGTSVTDVTATDTLGNTWGHHFEPVPTAVNGGIGVVWSVITNGGSSQVTITRSGTTNILAILWDAVSFSNFGSPIEDSAVFAVAQGTGIPGAPANTATQAYDLVVAATMIMLSAGQNYAEDLPHGWNSLANTGGSSQGALAAAYQVNVLTTALTYAPAVTVNTKKWASLQIGFTPPGGTPPATVNSSFFIFM